MSKIIDGNLIKDSILEELRLKYENEGKDIKIVFVIVGDRKDSRFYVKLKRRACKKVGIKTERLIFDKHISETELLNEIEKLNNDQTVNGILVQLPLPFNIDEKKITNAVDISKDIDCYCDYNLENIEKSPYKPCVPFAIKKIIQFENVQLIDKKITLIDKDDFLFNQLKSVHNFEKMKLVKTCAENRLDEIKNSDVIILHFGVPEEIKSYHLKNGTFVIDLGINRVEDRICGFADFDDCLNVVSKITPAVGGVGPVSVGCLVENITKS